MQCYVHDLKQYKAFVPCDNGLHRFALQDFSSDNLQLKVFIVHRYPIAMHTYIVMLAQHNRYVFVSRRAIILEDGLQWIFLCSCNESRAALIASLSHSAKATYAELSAGECLHIAATISIVQSIDAVHGISPISEFAGKYSIINIMVSMKCLIVNLYRPCLYSKFGGRF